MEEAKQDVVKSESVLAGKKRHKLVVVKSAELVKSEDSETVLAERRLHKRVRLICAPTLLLLLITLLFITVPYVHKISSITSNLSTSNSSVKREVRQITNAYSAIITSVNGERLWELRYSHGTIPTIKCDSIYTCRTFSDVFYCLKDNKQYAYSTSKDKLLFDATPIKSIITSSGNETHIYSTDGEKFHRAQTYDGCYYFFNDKNEYGPYEDILKGENGVMYKKDGKWGVLKEVYVNTSTSAFRTSGYYRYDLHIDPIYDAIMEIDGKNKYWIGKRGGKWHALGEYSGKEVYKTPSIISFFVSVQTLSYDKFRHRGYNFNLSDFGNRYKKFGYSECASLYIRDALGRY